MVTKEEKIKKYVQLINQTIILKHEMLANINKPNKDVTALIVGSLNDIIDRTTDVLCKVTLID